MKSLFAVSEDYPELKANENFINLQNQWTEIEDRLQAARRTYNAAVEDFLNKTQTMPSALVANQMDLPSFEMYEADEGANQTPEAKDLFDK